MKKRKVFFLITGMLGALIIGSGFAASVFVHEQLTKNLINIYATQQGILATQIAQTLTVEIEQIQTKLRLIAQLPEIMNGDTATCNEKIAFVLTDTSIGVNNVSRVGPDGIFRCSLNQKVIGLRADTFGAYFTQIFADPAHATVMGRAVKAPGIPGSGYAIGIHVPVWSKSGAFIGTAGGAIYLSDLEQKYLSNVTLPLNGHVALYDDDGTVLYNYKTELIGDNLASPTFQKLVQGGLPPQQSIQGIKDGVSGSRISTFAGITRISAFAPVHVFPGRNWRIAVSVPIEDAESSIEAVGLNTLLIELPIILSLLTLILLFFFVWTVTREVFTPLEAVDKAKSEFVSLASHQLRTPLTAINWYVEMLQRKDTGPLSEKQARYLGEIYTGSQRMVELVNALLNVSRLDMGTIPVEFSSVNLGELVQAVLKEQESQALTRRIAVENSFHYGNPLVTTDEKLMRMVFQNLISNAIKYTSEGGHVKVSITNSTKADTLLITVADTGWGIPKNEQQKIFTKLYRADNVKTKNTEGTGLGLYVVKSVVEKLDGTIRLESEENKGTTFFIELPRKIATAQENPPLKA